METSSLSISFPDAEAEEVKACCASFYENDLVRALLGDSFHPGGLPLTRRLGEALHLSSDDLVLDLACGQGTSACFLAKTFGCRVVGVDLSETSLYHARHRAEAEGVGELIEFRLGDAERLPGSDAEFSAVMSECSFCLFPDKPSSACEMLRVLRDGGRLGITDMEVAPSRLPEDMRGMLAHAACLCGALPVAEYREVLSNAGFTEFFIESHPEALMAMLGDIAKRILVAQIAQGLGKLDLQGLDLPAALQILKRCRQLVEDGVAGYVLMTALKR